MDLGLKGRRALVTGASYGLGCACAKMLLEEGAEVAIASREPEQLKRTAAELSSGGREAASFACDLAVETEVESLVPRVIEECGPIDILIVSTGHPPTFPFSEATKERWVAGLDLVLWPVITLAQAVIPGMRERRFGRLIFIGSILGIEPEPSSVIQSTLRTGLNAMTKCLATENGAFGITANVVCPGYFFTPLVEKVAAQYAERAGTTTDSILEDWKHRSPVNAFGKPDDLGALVAYLSSRRADFITGTTITIDGGAVRSW